MWQIPGSKTSPLVEITLWWIITPSSDYQKAEVIRLLIQLHTEKKREKKMCKKSPLYFSVLIFSTQTSFFSIHRHSLSSLSPFAKLKQFFFLRVIFSFCDICYQRAPFIIGFGVKTRSFRLENSHSTKAEVLSFVGGGGKNSHLEQSWRCLV